MTTNTSTHDPFVTLDLLRQAMVYNPLSGLFLRVSHRDARGHLDSRFTGRVAGWINQRGYRIIKVGGLPHRAHRLAWLWVYGSWPMTDLDHKNRVRDDNRISNLRLALHVQQNWNRSTTTGRTLPMGVYPGRNLIDGTARYYASIGCGNRSVNLGLHATVQEASGAYQAAAALLRDPSWHVAANADMPPATLPDHRLDALHHAMQNPRPRQKRRAE